MRAHPYMHTRTQGYNMVYQVSLAPYVNATNSSLVGPLTYSVRPSAVLPPPLLNAEVELALVHVLKKTRSRGLMTRVPE